MVTRGVQGTVAALAGFGFVAAEACTTLQYRDADGGVYLGRTLELQMELPYQVVFVPKGAPFASQTEGHPPVEFTTRLATVAIVMPDRVPTADDPLGPGDLKPLEGLNEAGLTFSLLAFPSVGGAQHQADTTRAVLSAVDLGSWALGQFATVAEVREALGQQEVILEPLAMLGGEAPPVHFVLHDRTGASIVIEFENGTPTIHDNPVGVMTNGPQFQWHLTNLANYTHLTNEDRSEATFGSLDVRQPDSGIATAGLPASNTSVGRFIRAVYYSQFAEAAATPDAAVSTLATIMNNFDRPRGITIDAAGGGEGDAIARLGPSDAAYSTEYTSWTSLSDMQRGRFFVRTYSGMNFQMLDLRALKREADGVRVMPLADLELGATDATETLLAARP